MRKKKRKFIAKWIVIGLAIIFGAMAVLAGGALFIFGSDAIDFLNREYGMMPASDDDRGGSSDEGEVSVNIEGSDVEDLGGSGASGGGGGGGSGGGNDGGSVGFICSEWQPVQYSLGNFFENIECLVYGVGGCDKVKATCGSEVFNLDYDIGGVFGIRHSLFSGDDEIGFDIVEKEVRSRDRKTLRTEIILEGSFDVGSLKCVVDSGKIPEKCLG